MTQNKNKNKFTVFGSFATGYGVAYGDGVVYDPDPDTDRDAAENLANFHNCHPLATYEDYLKFAAKEAAKKIMPNEKPVIIPPSARLAETILEMLKCGQDCCAKLDKGAVIRYRPGTSWSVYRKGEPFYSTSPTDGRFKKWKAELATFRAAIENADQRLGEDWSHLPPSKGWYGAQIVVLAEQPALI